VAAAVRVSIRAREICSQRDAERVLFGPGGSAAGPKPGRDGFSVELASRNGHVALAIRACSWNPHKASEVSLESSAWPIILRALSKTKRTGTFQRLVNKMRNPGSEESRHTKSVVHHLLRATQLILHPCSCFCASSEDGPTRLNVALDALEA
jgi:hypothetical protein